MDRTALLELRNSLGLTQTEFANRMGVPFRTYQDFEAGVSRLRPVHVMAAERAALTYAVETEQPMLAPAGVRREALGLARLLGK